MTERWERWDDHRHLMAQGVAADRPGFVRCDCAWSRKPHYKALSEVDKLRDKVWRLKMAVHD